ncbi:MAG: hypothetical protein B1H40_00425 [Candidatus Latescibacteria bacterium 4484_181]|nr:MAG: hypothetical protein B1H40_00425 [Candidatus Latescibacteria bacterium 4484_181]RKY69249.1 MAG: hypothetical protein DRQ02_01615 [Candidatus Latescibacterota bacterium]RKY73753.1 MAG: hypothetical protein DRQ24_01650 [Candidatus Latescibacterota bacterium]
MKRVFKIEFSLSGDLAELYEITLRSKDDKILLGQINRSLFASGMLQHLSALIAQGGLEKSESIRAKKIMGRLLHKALGPVLSSISPSVLSQQTSIAKNTYANRDIVLKGIERLKQVIQNTALPAEIILNEAQIFKKKLDKFLYQLGS